MSTLGKTVAGRAPGRPNRETTILQDRKKCKKKMQSSIEDDLTIFAQGDARKAERKEDYKY